MKQSMITVPAIIGTALLTTAIVRNTPAQQDRPADPMIASLSMKIDDLANRVLRLEHASDAHHLTESSGSFDHETPPDLSNASGGRWMIIDNVQTSQFSPDYSDKIADLESQASSLERTLENERENMRDIAMRRHGDRSARGDRERAQRHLTRRVEVAVRRRIAPARGRRLPVSRLLGP